MEQKTIVEILKRDHKIDVSHTSISINKIDVKQIWDNIDDLDDHDLFLMNKIYNRKGQMLDKLSKLAKYINQNSLYSVSFHLGKLNLIIIKVKSL